MKAIFVSAMVALLVSLAFAGPIDTGFKGWAQPDGTRFTARLWGDEFEWRMETQDGYRIIWTSDDWYYYATLDTKGEYAPTASRVGIDVPPAASYQLERSAERGAEIQRRWQSFDESIQRNEEWFAQRQGEAHSLGQSVVLRLGVIVVEFQDVRHYAGGTRPLGYSKADFDSMLLSQDFWYKPNPTPQDPSPHPENEPVFGSMRDYYWQMSRPNVMLTAS